MLYYVLTDTIYSKFTTHITTIINGIRSKTCILFMAKNVHNPADMSKITV